MHGSQAYGHHSPFHWMRARQKLLGQTKGNGGIIAFSFFPNGLFSSFFLILLSLCNKGSVSTVLSRRHREIDEWHGSSPEMAQSEDRQRGIVTGNFLEGDGRAVIKFSDLVSQFLHSLPLNQGTGREEGHCCTAAAAAGREMSFSRIIGLVPLLPLFNLFVCMFSRAEKVLSPFPFSFN